MPKFFGVPEFMLWCSKCFNQSKRIIQVRHSAIHPVSLNPLVFHRMLRLPNPNKELKLSKVDDFITNNGGPKRLLTYFTDSFSAR